MRPGVCDLEIYQGDTFELTVTLNQPVGTPVDASTWDWAGQIRPQPGSGELLADLDCEFDDDGTDGVIVVSLAAADTAALPAGTAAWDLQASNGGGWARTFLAGTVTVTAEVTRNG